MARVGSPKSHTAQPWDGVVVGDALLDAIVDELQRYIVLPTESAHAIALWLVAAYAADCFFIFPRLFITSPEKRCGKSTLLDILECLVNRPLVASNIRSAALFRSIEAARPTMILDEADTFMREDEDLRGVVNSGHKRNGSVVRCVGDDAEPRQFSTFAPMVIAGIGRQHETIEDRSVMVSLRRKLEGENVESFRPDRASGLERLARMAARFAIDARKALAAADPEIPAGIFNRQADNWRALLAVADAAGGEWPHRARQVALGSAALGGDTSARVSLLSDIRDIFEAKGMERVYSQDLVDALVALEGRPWSEWRNGKPISATGMAKLLAPFHIHPDDIRSGAKVAKGYKRDAFNDAFARYLVDTPDPTAYSATTRRNPGFFDATAPATAK